MRLFSSEARLPSCEVVFLFVCLGDGLVSDHLFIPLIYGDFLKKEIFVKTRNLVNCKSNYELLGGEIQLEGYVPELAMGPPNPPVISAR